jgi:hypothetical protein
MSYEDTLNYVQNKRYCISPTSVSLCSTAKEASTALVAATAYTWCTGMAS